MESVINRPLPAYKSHKTVWALKIAGIVPNFEEDHTSSGPLVTNGATITPEDKGYAPFDVGPDFMARHKPEVGGYWVQYADGYQSYSPAKAFEEGYTPAAQAPLSPHEAWPFPTLKVTDAMVSRFLCWPLPKGFAPDCGISFDGRKDDEWNKNKTWPVGTNLFDATQARQMLEHVLTGA